MAEDLREFIDEHFRRFDEKPDRLIDVLVELRNNSSRHAAKFAAMDNRDLGIEQRLERHRGPLGPH